MRLFIFDGDCAFCSSANRLLLKMTQNRLDSKPYQFLDLESLGLTIEDVQSSVQFIYGGSRASGARAIAEFLIASKTGWAFAGWVLRLPVVISFAELVYDLVAANRHRLPGGTPECQLPKQ